ncbi:MAG: hypothetical protein AAGI91_11580 [Bacteroidota bacterium]
MTAETVAASNLAAYAMTKRLLPILLLLLAAAPVSAQYAGSYARIGFGARGIAMGGGLVADVFSESSPYYHPALAPRVQRQGLDAAAGFLSFDRSLQYLQFAFPLPPRAGAALGVIRAGVENIDGRDNSGFHTDDLSTNEYVIFAAFGAQVSQRVSAGLGLRFYHADLFDTVDPAVGIALSLGLAAQVSENLALGLAVDDLIGRYRWDTSDAFGAGGTTTTDQFPVRVRLGGAYRLGGGRGTITAEIETQFQTAERRTERVSELNGIPTVFTENETVGLTDTRFHLGGEYWLVQPFGIRAGVDRLGAGAFEAASPAAGFAVRQPLGDIAARIDYTAVLEPYGLGVMHFVALHLDL